MCWHLWNPRLFLPLVQRAVPCRFVECLFEEYGLVRWRVGSPLRRQTFCSTQRTISYVHAVSRVCVGIWLRCPFLPKSRRQTITSYLETFVPHSQLLGIVVGDCNTHCQECHTVFIPGCGLNLYSAFLGSKLARLFLNCPELGKEPRPTKQQQDS